MGRPRYSSSSQTASIGRFGDGAPSNRAQRSALLQLWLLFRLFGDVNGVLELEGKQRLGRQNNLFVACESCAGCSRAAACQCADGYAFPASRKTANQSAEPCAAPNKARRALAFTLLHAIDRARGHWIAAPTRMDALKLDGKQRAAFEVAEWLGIDDRALCARVPGNDDIAVDENIVSNRGAK